MKSGKERQAAYYARNREACLKRRRDTRARKKLEREAGATLQSLLLMKVAA